MKISGWHASNHEFDMPSTLVAKLNRDFYSVNANGALGIWVTLAPGAESKATYGRHLYTFDVEVEPQQVGEYRVNHLMKMSSFGYENRNDAEFPYLQLREGWLQLGLKFIRLLEWDDQCAIGIILDESIISSWEPVTDKGDHALQK